MPTPNKEYVYLIGSPKFCWYKIGKSTRIEVRLSEIGILLPFKIEVIAVWETIYCTSLEQFMHNSLSTNRINGDWFSFDRFELFEVISASYPWSAKMVEGRGERVNNLYNFSNIERDVSKHKFGRFKDLRDKIAKKCVADWLFINGMDDSKENRQKAAKEASAKARLEFNRIVESNDIHAANVICANIRTVAQELETLRRARAEVL